MPGNDQSALNDGYCNELRKTRGRLFESYAWSIARSVRKLNHSVEERVFILLGSQVPLILALCGSKFQLFGGGMSLLSTKAVFHKCILACFVFDIVAAAGTRSKLSAVLHTPLDEAPGWYKNFPPWWMNQRVDMSKYTHETATPGGLMPMTSSSPVGQFHTNLKSTQQSLRIVPPPGAPPPSVEKLYSSMQSPQDRGQPLGGSRNGLFERIQSSGGEPTQEAEPEKKEDKKEDVQKEEICRLVCFKDGCSATRSNPIGRYNKENKLPFSSWTMKEPKVAKKCCALSNNHCDRCCLNN